MKRVQTILKSWIETDKFGFIRTFLLSEGFGFCLCLSFVFGIYLDRQGSVSGHLLRALLISFVSGTAVSCALTFFHACRRLLDPAKIDPSRRPGFVMHPDNRVSAGTWIIVTAIILVCWSVVWLAYYPGVFAYDADTQLSQTISRVYSTHHPLLHTLWLGWCVKLVYDTAGVNGAVALYAASQMFIMAVIFGWTVSEAVRRGAGKVRLVLYVAFIAVFPVHAILAVSVTKDVVFSGLTLVFAMLVARSHNAVSLMRDRLREAEIVDEDKGKTSIGRSLRDVGGVYLPVKIAVCAAFMCLFRNNASYALAFMVLILLIRQIGKNRTNRYYGLIIAITAGIAAGCLAGLCLKTILHAESGSPREAMSIPIQQMARVRSLYGPEAYVGSEDASRNNSETNREGFGNNSETTNTEGFGNNSDANVNGTGTGSDRILDSDTCAALDTLLSENGYWLYNEHLADPVKKEVNLKDPKLFVITWLKLMPKYPGEYLDAWLLTTEGAWYIYDTSVNEIYGTGGGYGYLSTDTRNMIEGFQVEPAPVFPGLKEALEKLVTYNAFQGVPVVRLLFSPALYVWINSAYIYGAIVRRKQVCALSGLFLVAYFITVLLGPAILVRYMYPYMIATILPLIGYKLDN